MEPVSSNLVGLEHQILVRYTIGGLIISLVSQVE